jgi:ubiquinone/menaquinone biosynthesis C-methylase UbiE
MKKPDKEATKGRRRQKGSAAGIELSEIYDKFAEHYDENRGLFDMTEVLNSFYGLIGKDKEELLDLGCGAGEPFARFFVEHGWKVTGVDFSEKMLDLAARYVPEMKTICADMRNIDFAPAHFTAVSAVYSLFHIPGDDQTTLLNKIYRWLRPQGLALFTYATKEYTGRDEFDGYKDFLGQRLYYSHKRPEVLYADLQNIGFMITGKDYRHIGGETFLWVTVVKQGK